MHVLQRDEPGQPDQDTRSARRSRSFAPTSERRLAALLESITDAFVAFDFDWHITYASRGAASLFGRSREELIGLGLDSAAPNIVGTPLFLAAMRAMLDRVTVNFEAEVPGTGRRFEIHAYPWEEGLCVSFRETTDRWRSQAFLAAERRLLELVAQGTPLQAVLEELTRTVEELSGDCLASILLVNGSRKHLLLAAAPSLPESYNRATNGLAIGPETGSCGTAAFLGKPAISVDIATDPLWEDHRQLALAHGLRACWAVPIHGSSKRVLGTFALYYREPQAPSDKDLRLIESAAHVAGIAVERHRSEARLSRLLSRALAARREAEGAERRYRELVDGLDAIVWQAEPFSLQLSFVSGQAERLLGYPSEAWRSNPDLFLSVIHPDDRDEVVRRCRAASRDGSDHQSEFRAIAADGRVVWMHNTIFVTRDRAGRPQQARGVMVDVTQRKQAEEQASLALERTEQIIENTSDAIIVSGRNARILTWNRGAERLFGWARDEVIGRKNPTLPRDLVEEANARRHQVMQNGQTVSYETERVTKDGRRMPVLASLGPLRDRNGNIIGCLGITKDLRAHKQLQEQSRVLDRLAERERIAMDLHDGVIQSLYGVALGLSARARALNDNTAETKDALQDAVAHIGRIIQDVREYIVGMRPHDLGSGGTRPQLEAMVAELNADAGLQVDLEVTPGVDRVVDGDAWESLLYICREALSNVIRHARASSVMVRLESHGNVVTLEVRDDGRGFNPSRTGRRVGDGLRNMRERARRLGGALHVSSEPGHGTSVRVELGRTGRETA